MIVALILVSGGGVSTPKNRRPASAADLKFLHHLPQSRPGTSNRKAALESYIC
jgi:hypothetical protein